MQEGNGAYFDLIAFVVLETALSESDIVNFYSETVFQTVKKSFYDTTTVEVYFEDNAIRVDKENGSFYTGTDGRRLNVQAYFDGETLAELRGEPGKKVVILQIVDTAEYFSVD